MNMMAHSFKEKVAQFDELTAAYERIDEVEAALRRSREFVRAIADGDVTEDEPNDLLSAIDDVLADKTILQPDEAWAPVFQNGC